MPVADRRVSSREVWGHAVANITPSAMPAFTIALVAHHGGHWTWLVYAVVGGIMFLVSLQMGILARHFPSPGSLFFYLASALHPIAGVVAGFTMILGYGGALLAAPLICGLFGSSAIGALPGPGDGQALLYPLSLLTILTAFVLARRGVEISARWGLVVEWFSVGCILLIGFFIFGHFGWLDQRQFPAGLPQEKPFFSALVLALLAYGGFETAGNLSAEAEAPGKIPAIMYWTVILVAIFFVFMAYVENLAFDAMGKSLGQNSTPLDTIAMGMGKPWLATVTDLAMAAAAFSASVATLNSMSRILWSMSRHHVLPAFLQKRHPHHRTPTSALAFLAGLVLAGLFLVQASHFTILYMVNILGTFTALGFVLLYVLANLAAVRLLFRHQMRQRWAALVIALSSIPLLGSVLWGTVSPFPPGALGYSIAGFFLAILLSLAWGIYRYRTHPGHLGSFVKEQY